jgi:hypothetical protein
LTRIDLSFLENLRSNWVVIIGLELLSIACPGLDLGSDIVMSLMLVSPSYCYGYLILLAWRIGFGVTGMKLVGVMLTVQGFVRCDAGSLWLVIIPKSKDRFMERPPMKTVQPRVYMGMAWHSMWKRLVLVYQLTIWGSCDGGTVGWCG